VSPGTKRRFACQKIQRRLTTSVPIYLSLTLLEVIRVLNLESLELRYLHFDLCQYYKILIYRISSIYPDVF